MVVVPHAGMWIEIAIYEFVKNKVLSFPTRECGLKFLNLVYIAMQFASFPTRECGLKY